jgi:hypothetical protein
MPIPSRAQPLGRILALQEKPVPGTESPLLDPCFLRQPSDSGLQVIRCLLPFAALLKQFRRGEPVPAEMGVQIATETLKRQGLGGITGFGRKPSQQMPGGAMTGILLKASLQPLACKDPIPRLKSAASALEAFLRSLQNRVPSAGVRIAPQRPACHHLRAP